MGGSSNVGNFSVWHWVIVLLWIANVAMIVHIAVSSQARGWSKALFVVASLLVPILPYIVWRFVAQSTPAPNLSVSFESPQQPEFKPNRSEYRGVGQTTNPLGSTPLATHAENRTSPERLLVENQIYGQIGQELETNTVDRALWTRLYAECDGDEIRTRVMYIRSRASSLIAAQSDFDCSPTKDSQRASDLSNAGPDELVSVLDENGFSVEKIGRCWTVTDPKGAQLSCFTIGELRRMALVAKGIPNRA